MGARWSTWYEWPRDRSHPKCTASPKFRALASEQRRHLKLHREQMIFGHATLADSLRYVAGQGWTVVGHRLDLLINPTLTVTFAVLARDQRGDFLAVTPVEMEGQCGMGIVNLCTAEAHFESLGAPGGDQLTRL